MQDVHALLSPGSVIANRYEVEALLGKGGFGAVYLAHDTRVKGNRFALKEVIDPKKQDRVHFLFEGELLRRLDHPALPRVYRAFEDESQPRVYLLMDYIKGTNLEQLRQHQPGKRFPLSTVLRLLAPIVDAVAYLHSQQPPVLHRDIKPSNIIIPPTESNPVLVDFGIAKEYDLDATTTAVRRLSPNYSAPEQYTQGTNPRTDIYGLAATCYALLTGTAPVDAFYRMTTLSNQEADPLVPVHQLVPEIPLHVSQAIERGMAITPSERFPTVQAFWDALQPSAFPGMSPAPVAALPMTPIPASLAVASDTQTAPVVNIYPQKQQQPSSRRRRVLPALFALIALAALLGGTFLSFALFAAHHPFTSSRVQGTPQAGQTAQPTHVIPTHTPRSTPSATAIATATAPTHPSPTAQPRATPATNYPLIQRAYNGTIHDTSGNINGDMSLAAMQQQGGNISGTFTLSNGLYGQAQLTGTISPNSTLSFMVTPYTQYLPLLFNGHINADGSLSGTYCSARGNQCDYASGGYGTWQVSPYSYGS